VRTHASAAFSLLAFTAALQPAHGADYYASQNGSGSTCSEASPCSLNTATGKPAAGDTVYLMSGTYTGLRPTKSGTESAWITFAAAPGAVPIINGGNVGSGSIQYVRYVGIVAQNGSSGGFGNGWTDGNCSTMSNGNLEYINCIADGNGINGIAHYCAGGLHIKQSIVLHNGNKDPSWSSGVNLFAVQGGATSNIVEQTISFENIDISSHHSDGSGFIMDQNSTGATFVNNIGFRNGGSCIRITNSPNAQIINNTCVNDGQDSAALYHDEIFFSDTSKTHQGALLRNNLCIPTSGQSGLTMGSGVTAQNNIFNGTASSVVSATGALDFHLASGSSAIDAGASGAPTPADEIGFDWKCIKEQSGQAVSWWNYAVDYAYVTQIGGVAKCFNSNGRTGNPDVGAHEYNATPGAGGASLGGASPGGASPGGASAGNWPGGGTATGGLSTGGTATSRAPSGGIGPGGAANGGSLPRGGTGPIGTANGGGQPRGGAGTGGSTTPSGGNGIGGTNTGGAVVLTGGQATGGTPITGGTQATGGAATGGDFNSGGAATGAMTSQGGNGTIASVPEAGGCSCRTGLSRHANGTLFGAFGFCLLALRRRRLQR
jgi:hypothetical protein